MSLNTVPINLSDFYLQGWAQGKKKNPELKIYKATIVGGHGGAGPLKLKKIQYFSP